MPELLAIPAWMTDPCPLADWIIAFDQLGYPPQCKPVENEGVFFRIESLSLEAFAEVEGDLVTAIDFEFPEPQSADARAVLKTIADSLGWELHEDSDDLD